MTAERHVSVPCMSIVRPATAEAVGEIRGEVRAFAAAHGANPAALASIVLAIDEAVANVVQHAYLDAPGSVCVEADIEDGEIELVVIDEGEGFTVGSPPRSGLGLGLGLMRDGTNAFEIRDRPAGGVEVWLSFRLTA
jgi:anti-sigma regulatory factor (Ser/Thr protein kinase)